MKGANGGNRAPGHLPLAGRRILVTRASGQANDLAALLGAAGAESVTIPTIRVEPPDDWEAVDRAVEQIARYDWIVFTSANGVNGLLTRLRARGRAAEALRGPKIAAVGTATARALGEHGLAAELIPATFQAEGLAASLREHGIAGARVLYARAAAVREVLGEQLRANGANLDEVVVYRTAPDREGAARLRKVLSAGGVDAAIFASPSSVHSTVEMLGEGAVELLSGPVIACIGPVTARAAREAGLRVDVVPAEHALPALIQALTIYFSELEGRV